MSKGVNTLYVMVFLVIIVLAVTVSSLYYFTQMSIESNKEAKKEEITTGKDFSRWDVEFRSTALTGGTNSQDSANDIQYEIYQWDSTKNANLKSEGWLDCSNAVPAKFDGTNAMVDLKEENFCVINPYLWWRDSNFDGGASDAKMTKYLIAACTNINDTDSSAATGEECTLSNSKTYLVTVDESATTDNQDLIPFAFLISSATKTTLNPDNFADGSINTRFSTNYYSEATAHSKTILSGTCSDSEGNDMNLDSVLLGEVSSSLTVATTINLDCLVNLDITTNGYAIPLKNPLATASGQKAYLSFTPYGMGVNGTGGGQSPAWELYGTGDLTGDVGYNGTGCPTDTDACTDRIIWESSSACGYMITDSSTVNAIKYGTERLYDNDCFDKAATKKMGVWGIWDKGATLTIDEHINQVKVDYDAAVAGVGINDSQIDYASGSSPDQLMYTSFVGMQSATDRIAQVLG